jgi:hypothetical protein
MAVAQTQSVLTPLASQAGLESLLRSWVPDRLSSPLIRYTPLEPLVTATAKAVAATWAAGRYADSVCRLRRAGADWLPAPLSQAMDLAPATLRKWSAEGAQHGATAAAFRDQLGPAHRELATPKAPLPAKRGSQGHYRRARRAGCPSGAESRTPGSGQENAGRERRRRRKS